MKPIRLKPDEVRSILRGDKQLRIIIAPQPNVNALGYLSWNGKDLGKASPESIAPLCPYAQPGEKRWVQESFRRGGGGSLIYLADEPWHKEAGWTPSSHMTRYESRITLEIESVTVEQDGREWVWVIEFKVAEVKT